MRKGVVAVAAALLAGALASGDWPLLGSFPAPGLNPRGIELASAGGSPAWLVVDGSTPYVYLVNSNNGSIYSSFAAPGGPGAWGVCRASGGNLYLSNYTSSYVYTVTTAGSVLTSFHSALNGPADMDNLYGLYIAYPNQNLIAQVNPTTGSIIASYPGPGSHVNACYSMQYFTADTSTHRVYQNGGAIVTSIQTPNGLCGEATTYRDSTVIWVADDATDRVYIYGIGVAVIPASFGRVKAVYR